MKRPCVYILSNRSSRKLYIGVTAYIVQRIWMHKNGLGSSYANKYNIDRLVYFEFHQCMPSAIKREKQMKKWYRQWKINLIQIDNPEWKDLYQGLL